jgi:hypothetical protein
MNLAPITLFAYNRPRHIRQTVESLQKNELAAESDLFIYTDGPKKPEHVDSVHEVREYVHSVDGFRSVKVIERDENYGLARSIITGVTEVVNRFGRVIVLEDDLVMSPYFLRYMNDALERYRDEKQVMHIAGYMYPINPVSLPQTLFYRQTTCWGWATWQRSWRHFESDALRLAASFDRQMRHRFTIEGSYDFWEHLRLNCSGAWETWAIKWYASVFLAGGLCLHPTRSLVANIGLDASGTNCSPTKLFDVAITDAPVLEFETYIEENKIALGRIRRYLRPSFIGRMFRLVLSLFNTRKTV